MNQFMDARMKSQTKEVPEDIVTEIKLRLPVKSLIRFKCVSKHWFSLITDPKFHQLHLNRHRDQHNHFYDCVNSTTNSSSSYPQSSVIYSYSSNGESKVHCIGGGYSEKSFEEAVDLDLDFYFPQIQGPSVKIKGSCDGLVCLVIGKTTLALWNPSIRQHRILPLPQYTTGNSEVYGLGYDSSIEDYKVVRLPSGTCPPQVLNLKSNSWRRIQDPHYIIFSHDQTPIASHGGLYSLVAHNYVRIDLDLDLILRFDLADETFSEISLPPPVKFDLRYRCFLGLWGGFLSILHEREFWVMKGDCGQSWTKVMNIIPKIAEPPDSIIKPLCFTTSGKVVIAVAFAQKKFFLYDPREETVRELHIHCVQEYRVFHETQYFEILQKYGWFHETLYFESLVSPHGGNAKTRLEKSVG